MIRGLIDSMLGDAGRSVLQFYEQHALLFGLVIVAYGICMYLSWQNLIQIYRFLVLAAAATLKADPSTAQPTGMNRRPKGRSDETDVALPWQQAVDSVRFPFVSPRAGLWPQRKSIAAAQKIIDPVELWEHARAVAAGVDVRRISPAYRLAAPQRTRAGGKD
jgi:hypothetical protein